LSDRQKIVKAVIPAAGFGTRMLPATKVLPKEMLPVAGKPLIQYAIEEAAASGIKTVVLVVRSPKSLIQSHFAPDPALESFLEEQQLAAVEDIRRLTELVDLQFVEQQRPLGLAHAICCAKALVGVESFAVLLPDVIMVNDEPVTHQLIRTHEQHGGSVVAIRQVEPQEVERHGIVQAEHSAADPSSPPVRVTGLVEKPPAGSAPSRLGIFGRYVLEPSIWGAIGQTGPDPRGEVQLTDALNLLCKDNSLLGLCFEGQHYDAGDRLGYLKANIELSLRNPLLRQPLREYLARLRPKLLSSRSTDPGFFKSKSSFSYKKPRTP
jgi:UTP--glucose-1-phosphate uridylyltransferase